MMMMIMMARTERRIPLYGWFFVFGFIAAVGAESIDMSESKVDCPAGWVNVHRGCFKFVEAGEKWEEAREKCRSERGDLTYIQSLKEKNLLEEHLRTYYPTFSQWWLGLQRQAKSGTDWKWLDEGPVDSAVLPWRIPRMAGRPGNVCGVLEMFGGSIFVANEICSRTKPFICEFNSITQRPAVVRNVEEDSDSLTDPTVPVPPTIQPTKSGQAPDDCSCQDTSNEASSEESSEEVDEKEAVESSKIRLERRHFEALQAGDELYQMYLQSEISANKARIAYYDKVSKLYADALEAQSRYYSSYQQQLDLDIAQKKEAGVVCA